MAPVAIGVLLAFAASRLLAPSGDGPAGGIVAQAYLNLGAIEIMQAWLGGKSKAEAQQHLAAAELHLGRALDNDPRNPAVYRNLAALELGRGQAWEARRLLAEAEGLADPGDSQLFFQLGRLYRAAGSVDEAIEAWLRVDRTMNAWLCSSTDIQFIEWAARLLRTERVSDAIKVSRAAIRVTPTHPRGYSLLADAVAKHGGDQAAMAALREVVQAQPDVPWPYEELARLAGRLGRADEARAWQEQAAAARASPAWADMLHQYRQDRNCDELLSR